jgi:hypothetical protein
VKRALSASLAAACLFLVLVATAAAEQPVEVATFGTAGEGAGQLARPGGVAVDQATGEVFVADTNNNRIDAFGAEGTFLRAWGWGVLDGSAELQVCEATCLTGIRGGGEGQLSEPMGIAVAPNGTIFEIDLGNAHIHHFTTAGALIKEFGGFGNGDPEKPDGSLHEGNDISVSPLTGEVAISDGYGVPAKVLYYKQDGTFVKSITGGSGSNQLFNASALAFDNNGDLYVIDPFAFRIDVFDPAGNLIRKQAEGSIAAGLAIKPSNNHLFVQTADQFGENNNLLEFNPAGEEVDSVPIPGYAQSPEGFESFGLAYSGFPTLPGQSKGALYAADLNGDKVLVLASEAPKAPAIESVFVSSLSSNAANLNGTINPNGSETTYYFKFGTTAAYGSASPPLPKNIGQGKEGVAVGVHLAGLAPNTTYHYALVATNEVGTTESTDRTFRTDAAGDGGSATLPDGRGYELVSPLDKNLNDITEAIGISSASGESVAFTSFNGLPGAENGGLLGAYVATRGPNGWTTVPASPPDYNEAGLLVGTPLAFSRELNQDVVKSFSPLAGPAPVNGGGNLYLRTNLPTPATNRLITTLPVTPVGETPTYTVLGASADFSKVLFEANGGLTANAPELGGGSTQVYLYNNGTLELGSILPGGEPAENGAQSAPILGIPKPNTISADGSRFFFESPTDFSTPAQIYMRVGGTQTIEISTSQRGEADPLGPQSAAFQGAAANGSAAFFTSKEELTENAATGEDTGANLYRYDTATGGLEDLTVDTNPADLAGADVRQTLVSADGSTVYFGASGELAAGGTPGGNNLYRWRAGEGVSFVSPLGEGSPFMAEGGNVQATAQTTANGGVLAFTSVATLPGAPVEENENGNPAPEIYRWAGSGIPACISCTGRGVPVHGSLLAPPTFIGGGNSLSADGSRVTFQTDDSLVSSDRNEAGDVYEWEAGQISLISSGGGSEAILLDASPSGNDIFFTTRNQLVPSDTDDNVDVYDARVGGSSPGVVTATPCSGESCRPPSAAPPGAALNASQGFNGPGNLKPKHKAKKHKKHAKKCKAKKGKNGKKAKKCTKPGKKHGHGKKG